jgi:hypothetical protein
MFKNKFKEGIMKNNEPNILDDILNSAEAESLEKEASEKEAELSNDEVNGAGSLVALEKQASDNQSLTEKMAGLLDSDLTKEASEEDDFLMKVAEETLSDTEDMEAYARHLGKIAADSFIEETTKQS